MTRIVNRPLMVTLRDNKLYSFLDGRETHVIVEIIDSWQEGGAWWNNEPDRHVYRVITRDMVVCDIERVGANWVVYRVFD